MDFSHGFRPGHPPPCPAVGETLNPVVLAGGDPPTLATPKYSHEIWDGRLLGFALSWAWVAFIWKYPIEVVYGDLFRAACDESLFAFCSWIEWEDVGRGARVFWGVLGRNTDWKSPWHLCFYTLWCLDNVTSQTFPKPPQTISSIKHTCKTFVVIPPSYSRYLASNGILWKPWFVLRARFFGHQYASVYHPCALVYHLWALVRH